MARLSFQFRRTHGGKSQKGSADYDPQGSKKLPIVVMVHGMGGEERDWTDPAYYKLHFNYQGPSPADRNLGNNHAWPPVGFPAILPQSDAFDRNIRPWRKFLKDRQFRTVVYTQRGGVRIEDCAVELKALLDALFARSDVAAGDVVSLLGQSRGGLIMRKFLKDDGGSPTTLRVRSFVSLHTSHSGSYIANIAEATSMGVGAIIQGANPVPLVGPMVAAALSPIASRWTGPRIQQLQVGGPFLIQLAAGEAPLNNVAYYTFGGTSTTFTRVWQFLYTPDSWIPRSLLPPRFRHRAEAVQWPIVSPALETFLPITDEIIHGRGDILVADARARLPFAVHRTNHINHVEAYWDRGLQNQVVDLL